VGKDADAAGLPEDELDELDELPHAARSNVAAPMTAAARTGTRMVFSLERRKEWVGRW
jgi:hypothetical protein